MVQWDFEWSSPVHFIIRGLSAGDEGNETFSTASLVYRHFTSLNTTDVTCKTQQKALNVFHYQNSYPHRFDDNNKANIGNKIRTAED